MCIYQQRLDKCFPISWTSPRGGQRVKRNRLQRSFRHGEESSVSELLLHWSEQHPAQLSCLRGQGVGCFYESMVIAFDRFNRQLARNKQAVELACQVLNILARGQFITLERIGCY